MDLHMFPLDSDYFGITVGPKDDDINKVILSIDDTKHGTVDSPGNRIKSSNLTEWTLDVPGKICAPGHV